MLLTITTTLLLIFTTTATATTHNGGAGTSCARHLVSFSPCLSFASLPPNNITDTPSALCCRALSSPTSNTASSSSSSSSYSYCLCYLLNNTSLFGFPLNYSRILMLPDSCSPLSNSTLLPLETICSGTPQLPPLVDSDISKGFSSGPSSGMPPSIGLPPIFAENSAGSFRPPSSDGGSAFPGTIVDSSGASEQVGSEIDRILVWVLIVKMCFLRGFYFLA